MTPSRRDGSTRPAAWTSVVAWLPVLALVVVAVGPALVGRAVFLGVDLIESAPPWASTSPYATVHNQCLGDVVDSAMPSALEFRRGLADGATWPDFTTMASAGSVLGGNPSTGVVSPLFLASVPFPETTFTAWIKVFEVLTVLVGTVAWARRLGLGAAAGALGGFLFLTSGFMIMWTNWPQTRTAAFFPLLFWCLERIVQDRTVRSALPLPLVVAALALGGFPAIVVHAAYLGAAYAIVRWVAIGRERRGVRADADADAGSSASRAGGAPAPRVRRAGHRLAAPLLALGGGAVAFALVAWQLVPWAAQLGAQDLSHRRDFATETLPAPWLLTTVFGQGLGTCSTAARWWVGGAYPNEAMSFVGAAAVVLVAVALVHRTRAPRGVVPVLAVGAALALAISFGAGISNALLEPLPGLGGSYLWRVRAVGGMASAMLAAIGFDALVAGPRPVGRRRRVALGVAGALPLLLIAAYLVTRALATRPVGWQTVHGSVLTSLAAGVAAALLWWAVLTTRQRRVRVARVAVALVIPVLVAVEGVWTARAYWPLVPADTLYRDTPAAAWLREHTGAGAPGSVRVAGIGTTFHGSGASAVGLRSLSGHGFVPPAWAGLVRAADHDAFLGDARTVVSLSRPGRLADPVMDRLAVRFSAQDPATAPAGVLAEFDGAGEGAATGQGLFERTVAVRALDAGDVVRGATVRVAAYDPATPEPGAVPACAASAALELTVRDAAGAVLASTARALDLHTAVSFQSVAIAPLEPALRERQARVEVRVTGCAQVALAPPDPLLERGPLREGVVLDPGDGLRVVDPALTGGALVHENLGVLPRVRWARAVDTCASAVGCAHAMAAAPADTVLVHPDLVPALPTDGADARVEVVLDAGDRQVVEVDAAGAGVLVVADAVQVGWRAYLDGEPVPLHTVDGALRGVAVPAGHHEVRLAFEPVGRGLLGPLALAAAGAWVVSAVVVLRRGGWPVSPRVRGARGDVLR